MASRKPLVLIFIELAQPTATPTIPDLRTVIIGPAYDVKDYLDDGTELLLASAYGEADTDNPYTPPATGTDAVVVNEGAYPGQSPGSRVDHTSVVFTLQSPRVILGTTYVSGSLNVIGTSITTNALDRTLISLNGMVSLGFVTAGVQPGDRLILTSSAGQTCVRVVASVGEPNASGLIPGGNENLLRTTQELPDAGAGSTEWTYGVADGEMRIERVFSNRTLLDPTATWITFPTAASDRLVLRGGVTLDIDLTPRPTVATPNPTTTVVSRPLSYAGLFLGYRALRQDLARLATAQATDEITVNGVPTIRGVGKIDARNPLAVALQLALANGGGVPIEYFGVQATDSTGYAYARARLAARDDLYCFVPLTQDLNILGAYKTAFELQADPLNASTTGVPQRFRIVLGSVPLPVTTTVYEGSLDGVASAVSGTTTGLFRTLIVDSASTGSNLAFANVLPGDTLSIGLLRQGISAWTSRRGTHTVGHVNASFALGVTSGTLEIIPSTSRWLNSAAGSDDIEFRITSPDGTVRAENLAQVTISTGTGPTLGSVTYGMANPTTSGGPYTILYVSSGVADNTVAVSVVGFSITLTMGTLTTHTELRTAVLAHSLLGALFSATTTVVASGGSNAVDPASQATRTAVALQSGSVANIVAGAAAGHMRVTDLTAMTAASVGRYLTISGAASGGNNGTFLIAAVNSATSVDVVNAAAVIPDANNGALAWVERYAFTSVLPLTGSCTATIAENDTLFNQLDDSSASFLRAGVRAGDTLEFPLDPNDYGPSAYTGRVLQYVVSSVLSESRLRIANGLDDTGSTAQELPHYYARDVRNRLIDNTAPNALSYRIRRALNSGDTVLALAGIAQSVRSKRLTLGFPPEVGVSDLRDGSLVRALPTVRTLAGRMPGWALMAAIGGAIAGIPPQMGLTYGTFIGIDETPYTTDYFSPEELAQIGDAGYMVCVIETEDALPICQHQLTTDTTALETGELSVVKNVDYLAMFYMGLLRNFLGQYNNIPEALNELRRSVEDNTLLLAGRKVARIGAPIVSGEIVSLALSDASPDTVEMFFAARIPVPINRIAFHLVVRTS